jgi:hypothetical protein
MAPVEQNLTLESGPSRLSNNEHDIWYALTDFLHDALYAHKLSRTKASVYYRTNSAMIVLACERSTKLTKNIEDQHTDAGDGNGRGSKIIEEDWRGRDYGAHII